MMLVWGFNVITFDFEGGPKVDTYIFHTEELRDKAREELVLQHNQSTNSYRTKVLTVPHIDRTAHVLQS